MIPRSFLFAAALCGTVANSNSVLGQIDVSLTRVRDPTWSPSQVHLFSAPSATDEEFVAVNRSIRLGDFFASLTSPIYDTVLVDAISAAGYVNASVYATTAIDGQNGSYLAFIVVADPGIIGSTRRFDSGPVIPKSVFPINANAALRRDGEVMDDIALSNAGLGDNFDGTGFAYFLFESDANFFPTGTRLTGSWEWDVSLRDSIGNGWDMAVPFQVVSSADFDKDGDVDGDDFLSWQAAFGCSGGCLVDADGDDDTDGEDLLPWQDQLGASVVKPGNSASVPAPHSLALAFIACLWVVAARWRGSLHKLSAT